jgi:hypothetical protein
MYISSRGETGAPTYVLNASRDSGGLGFVTAAAAIISAAATGATMFGGKEHRSPWGFLYDEYPRKIYEAEAAIAQATGQPLPPDPGGGATPAGGPQYQASMLAIVPRYVPGSESQIAAYDRRLNEPNGAYEVTYTKQLGVLQSLAGGTPQPTPAQTMPARPVYSSIPSVQVTPAVPLTAAQRRAAGLPMMQASMLPDLGPYGPMILIGGAALVLILSMNAPAPKGKSR